MGLLAVHGLRTFGLPVIRYTGTYQQRMVAAHAATVRPDSLVNRIGLRDVWAIVIGVVALTGSSLRRLTES